MQGLMQDVPLTLPHLFGRAEHLFFDKELVTVTATGVDRSDYGTWAERARRLGGVLDDLGVSADGRVATFAWNTARHLELYFAIPCTGRTTVTHSGNNISFSDLSVSVCFPSSVTFGVAGGSLSGNNFTAAGGYNSTGCGAVTSTWTGFFSGDGRLMNLRVVITPPASAPSGCGIAQFLGEISR